MDLKKQERASRMLVIAVLILFVLTVITTPLSMAKFKAVGVATASARVAKWDIVLLSKVPSPPSSIPATSGGIIKLNSSTGSTVSGVVRITNKSEVIATATPRIVKGSAVGGVTASNITVTFSPASADIAIGGYKDFNMTVSTTASTDGYIELEIACDASQVD